MLLFSASSSYWLISRHLWDWGKIESIVGRDSDYRGCGQHSAHRLPSSRILAHWRLRQVEQRRYETASELSEDLSSDSLPWLYSDSNAAIDSWWEGKSWSEARHWSGPVLISWLAGLNTLSNERNFLTAVESDCLLTCCVSPQSQMPYSLSQLAQSFEDSVESDQTQVISNAAFFSRLSASRQAPSSWFLECDVHSFESHIAPAFPSLSIICPVHALFASACLLLHLLLECRTRYLTYFTLTVSP